MEIRGSFIWVVYMRGLQTNSNLYALSAISMPSLSFLRALKRGFSMPPFFLDIVFLTVGAVAFTVTALYLNACVHI